MALDQVQDPRNFGAVLRTAEVFGAHGVIVPKHHQVGLTDAAARAAMGAVEHLPVARETNLVNALEIVKKSGIWVYGGVAGAGVPVWGADLTGPLCLVLGSEGGGLRPLVAQACDVLVTIPMRGKIGSLNVAAAGAVLCYEVARQRGAGAKCLTYLKVKPNVTFCLCWRSSGAEQLPCKQWVGGSNPPASASFSRVARCGRRIRGGTQVAKGGRL